MVEWIVKRAQGDRARVGTLTGVVCILAMWHYVLRRAQLVWFRDRFRSWRMP